MQLLNFGIIDNFEDWVVFFLTHQGFFAPLFLLFIEEAGIPIPTSDFVITYMGYQVSRGSITFLEAFVILLITDLLGVSVLYYICYHYGAKLIDVYGKFIDIDTDKLSVVEAQFRKFGIFFIIVGRHIIGMRIPITIYSGISKIPYRVFIASTFVSVILWIPFYLTIGQKLGPKTLTILHQNKWYGLLFLIPIIASFLPLLFLRKSKKTHIRKPKE